MYFKKHFLSNQYNSWFDDGSLKSKEKYFYLIVAVGILSTELPPELKIVEKMHFFYFIQHSTSKLSTVRMFIICVLVQISIFNLLLIFNYCYLTTSVYNDSKN